MIKYQNGQYVYLYPPPPPILLINTNQAGKVLIYVYSHAQHVVIIIYLQN